MSRPSGAEGSRTPASTVASPPRQPAGGYRTKHIEPASPELLTVDQVAELLTMSKWFVYEHGAELGLVKLGGANRYRADVVRAYAQGARSEAAPGRIPVARVGERRVHGGGRRRVALLEAVRLEEAA